ncbi:methyltransferase [Streptomyces hesseae]|uniref:Methyltransferase n=1 Tax=Streptomyces hesseae TaxID=3075519 RepID=A0ABU2SIF8_9ACTN|nr:methyltransferase [Streptomyces sp. DSM 40473]MDT0448189.1 methyltransferase [Streptomyces sp. DSM 40473]
MNTNSYTGVRPLTPAPLMAMADGFRVAKVLAVALDFDLFTKLSGTEGTTPEELGRAEGLAARPATLLLTACASLGLLDKRDGRYVNSELSEEFLVRGKRYFFGDLVTFTDRREYEAWGKLDVALRTDRPNTWDPETEQTLFDPQDEHMAELFPRAAHSGAVFTARAMALSHDFTAYRKLLDVGGGLGSFCGELCAHHTHLRATVYDLPFVSRMAEKRLAETEVGDRVNALGGDFFADDLPTGYDAILLTNILHDWSDEESARILAKCHAALGPGGEVIIGEAFLDDDGTGPVAGAVAGLNMLVETAAGTNRSREAYTGMLTRAGFTDIRRVGLVLDAPLINGALVARRA